MSYGLKLLMLLSAPFPLRHSAAIRLARHPRLPFEALSSAVASHGRILSVVPLSKRGFSVRASKVAKEGFCDTVTSNPRFKDSYSWPEWSKLTNHLLAKSHSQGSVTPIDDDDSFSAGYNLSEEFLSAAGACLNFAREKPDILRLLTKKYIKTVVEHEFPYLFKNAEKSVSRMRLFLGENGSIPLESEKAQTVDIMRYLLSYMYKPFSTSNGNQLESDESVETSVRKLLLELFNVSGTIWGSKLAEPAATEAPFPNEPLSRPRGHSVEMKRGDWICQKCTYMNFARNMSCLECGNARPKLLRTGAEWECPQCDFFNYGRNNSCLRCDCKRPADSLPPDPVGDRSSVRLGSDATSDSISRSLDRILGRSSTSSQNQPTSGENHFRSSQFGQNAAKPRGNPDVAPFVPLPPDMFRKNPESSNGGRQLSDRGTAADLIDSLLKGSEGSMKANESSDASISNAASGQEHVGAAPENDFPDIMPMRKGENRFVVSKKKDRSLTSPAYKRRLAMEQANSYNAVPFVPFPPDYFAKKDNPPPASSTEANQPSAKAEALPDQGSNRNNFNSSGDSNLGVNPSQSEVENAGYGSFDSPNASSESYTASSTRPSYGGFNRTSFAGPTENPSQPSSRSQSNESGGYNASVGSPAPPQTHQNTRNSVNYSYSGKSLEGSCVKEPDPLDMSEEAKAERWFRRAAQIKDISELSQIPDEDFPEIMPLRKGVNRFVVSKRKTPLERRLTSPQYRKNLPVVSSEPEKDSGD